ncbi:ficolin-1-A-like [Apostichopus japonicus]|uniref:ficolin-1-A-like n=1 Tax=Stichopus japonicus TaxID=307972 RepID=UPI003AB32EC9
MKSTVILLLTVAYVALIRARDSDVRGHFKCTNKVAEKEDMQVHTTNEVPSGPNTTPYATTKEEQDISTTKDVTSEPGSSNEGTSLPVDATSYTTIRTNCLTSNGSVIQNGSLLVNEDCTRISTCDNGVMNYNDLYQCSSDAVCEVRNDVRKCYCMSGYHGNGVNCTKHMADCKYWYDAGNTTNGIYTIKPTNWSGASFDVSCNMTDGGGWTVFQRRVNGSVDFNRTWISYKGGFGDVSHEFWLGNEKLYHLTNQGNYQLRVDFVNRSGNPFYAKFDRFRINNESDNYRLSRIGKYSGNAGGSGGFGSRLNYSFSTSDKNNGGCSDDYHCGWWFRECRTRSLNGDYHAALNVRSGVSWYRQSDYYDNIEYTEMKIKPV